MSIRTKIVGNNEVGNNTVDVSVTGSLATNAVNFILAEKNNLYHAYFTLASLSNGASLDMLIEPTEDIGFTVDMTGLNTNEFGTSVYLNPTLSNKGSNLTLYRYNHRQANPGNPAAVYSQPNATSTGTLAGYGYENRHNSPAWLVQSSTPYFVGSGQSILIRGTNLSGGTTRAQMDIYIFRG